ncbi:TadE-like protein [Bryocella elongata]|uniref:TadE-like protein n=1 Tax=Bryocella elongata TaxID=863522 RepID=A0A1H5Y254_9BACT|nr:TadE/TadG family type IV pilus assembly protein [Bryocella elongata]SEG17626.1 TadE-like protein [Bryocella elongata]
MRFFSVNPLLSWVRRFGSEESGESLISIALSLSIMLGFTFGIIQVGLGYYNKERMSECAREAARYAILHGNTCTNSGGSCSLTTTQIATYAQGLGYPNLGSGTTTCTAAFYTSAGASTTSNAPGNLVQVSCSYTFPYKIPFMNTSPLTLTSASEMTILM